MVVLSLCAHILLLADHRFDQSAEIGGLPPPERLYWQEGIAPGNPVDGARLPASSGYSEGEGISLRLAHLAIGPQLACCRDSGMTHLP